MPNQSVNHDFITWTFNFLLHGIQEKPDVADSEIIPYPLKEVIMGIS